MLVTNRKGVQFVRNNVPVIGIAYVGPNTYRNAATQEFWSVSMPLTESEATIQKWMLKKVKHVTLTFKVICGEVKDYSYNPSLLARCLRKLYFWC